MVSEPGSAVAIDSLWSMDSVPCSDASGWPAYASGAAGAAASRPRPPPGGDGAPAGAEARALPAGGGGGLGAAPPLGLGAAAWAMATAGAFVSRAAELGQPWGWLQGAPDPVWGEIEDGVPACACPSTAWGPAAASAGVVAEAAACGPAPAICGDWDDAVSAPEALLMLEHRRRELLAARVADAAADRASRPPGPGDPGTDRAAGSRVGVPLPAFGSEHQGSGFAQGWPAGLGAACGASGAGAPPLGLPQGYAAASAPGQGQGQGRCFLDRRSASGPASSYGAASVATSSCGAGCCYLDRRASSSGSAAAYQRQPAALPAAADGRLTLQRLDSAPSMDRSDSVVTVVTAAQQHVAAASAAAARQAAQLRHHAAHHAALAQAHSQAQAVAQARAQIQAQAMAQARAQIQAHAVHGGHDAFARDALRVGRVAEAPAVPEAPPASAPARRRAARRVLSADFARAAGAPWSENAAEAVPPHCVGRPAARLVAAGAGVAADAPPGVRPLADALADPALAGLWTERDARVVLAAVARDLAALHDEGWIHRGVDARHVLIELSPEALAAAEDALSAGGGRQRGRGDAFSPPRGAAAVDREGDGANLAAGDDAYLGDARGPYPGSTGSPMDVLAAVASCSMDALAAGDGDPCAVASQDASRDGACSLGPREAAPSPDFPPPDLADPDAPGPLRGRRMLQTPFVQPAAAPPAPDGLPAGGLLAGSRASPRRQLSGGASSPRGSISVGSLAGLQPGDARCSARGSLPPSRRASTGGPGSLPRAPSGIQSLASLPRASSGIQSLASLPRASSGVFSPPGSLRRASSGAPSPSSSLRRASFDLLAPGSPPPSHPAAASPAPLVTRAWLAASESMVRSLRRPPAVRVGPPPPASLVALAPEAASAAGAEGALPCTATPATDVWALGCLLFGLLSGGHVPFGHRGLCWTSVPNQPAVEAPLEELAEWIEGHLVFKLDVINRLVEVEREEARAAAAAAASGSPPRAGDGCETRSPSRPRGAAGSPRGPAPSTAPSSCPTSGRKGGSATGASSRRSPESNGGGAVGGAQTDSVASSPRLSSPTASWIAFSSNPSPNALALQRRRRSRRLRRSGAKRDGVREPSACGGPLPPPAGAAAQAPRAPSPLDAASSAPECEIVAFPRSPRTEDRGDGSRPGSRGEAPAGRSSTSSPASVPTTPSPGAGSKGAFATVGFGPEARDLVLRLFAADPGLRPAPAAVLADPWFAPLERERAAAAAAYAAAGGDADALGGPFGGDSSRHLRCLVGEPSGMDDVLARTAGLAFSPSSTPTAVLPDTASYDLMASRQPSLVELRRPSSFAGFSRQTSSVSLVDSRAGSFVGPSGASASYGGGQGPPGGLEGRAASFGTAGSAASLGATGPPSSFGAHAHGDAAFPLPAARPGSAGEGDLGLGPGWASGLARGGSGGVGGASAHAPQVSASQGHLQARGASGSALLGQQVLRRLSGGTRLPLSLGSGPSGSLGVSVPTSLLPPPHASSSAAPAAFPPLPHPLAPAPNSHGSAPLGHLSAPQGSSRAPQALPTASSAPVPVPSGSAAQAQAHGRGSGSAHRPSSQLGGSQPRRLGAVCQRLVVTGAGADGQQHLAWVVHSVFEVNGGPMLSAAPCAVLAERPHDADVFHELPPAAVSREEFAQLCRRVGGNGGP